MLTASLILILIEALLVACVLADLAWPWLIAIAISPVLLLLFWKKPTLKAAQNVFAIVFALAFGSVTVFAGNNIVAAAQFYTAQYVAISYIAAVAVAIFVLGYGIALTTKQHYRLFLLGTACSVAYCCIPQTSQTLCAACFGLVMLATAFYFASAVVLNKRLKCGAQFVEVRNVAPQLLIRNLAIVATTVNIFFVLTTQLLTEGQLQSTSLTTNIVCAVLDFVLIFSYLRQPMDFVTEKKLQLCLEQNSEIDAQKIKEQLHDRLNTWQNYPIAALLRKLLYIFIPCKMEGMENVTEASACFVANHYEVYGPFITALKFPKIFMPWTDRHITDKSTLANQLRSGIDVSMKWVVKPLRRRLHNLVAPPVWKIVNYVRPITIARKGSEEIDKMLLESVDALVTGDSLMIFPENPPEGMLYKNGGVDKFQTGFAEVAEVYRERTGKDMAFYPLYIDKFGKRMIVGQKVVYNCQNEGRDEKTRVADELYRQMCDMATQCENKRKKRR